MKHLIRSQVNMTKAKIRRLLCTSFNRALGLPNFKRIVFDTNNYCNLHCEFCMVNQGEKFELSPLDVAYFCERFKGIGERNDHRLVGGETTMMPLRKLLAIIDEFRVYGRKLSILSNGYNLLGLGWRHLKKFDTVYLDDHGINHEHIRNCKSDLTTRLINVKVREKHFHYNFVQGIKRHAKPCKSWMNTLTVSQGLIYPCCNLPAVERYHKDKWLRQHLFESGWFLENPNVKTVLLNWRKTIPYHAMTLCLSKCWVPNLHQCQKVSITLKPNDKVKAS